MSLISFTNYMRPLVCKDHLPVEPAPSCEQSFQPCHRDCEDPIDATLRTNNARSCPAILLGVLLPWWTLFLMPMRPMATDCSCVWQSCAWLVHCPIWVVIRSTHPLGYSVRIMNRASSAWILVHLPFLTEISESLQTNGNWNRREKIVPFLYGWFSNLLKK